MLSPPRQQSFSAKSHPTSPSGPPRKKKQDSSRRDYLRPDEVEAMVQAARKSVVYPYPAANAHRLQTRYNALISPPV